MQIINYLSLLIFEFVGDLVSGKRIHKFYVGEVKNILYTTNPSIPCLISFLVKSNLTNYESPYFESESQKICDLAKVNYKFKVYAVNDTGRHRLFIVAMAVNDFKNIESEKSKFLYSVDLNGNEVFSSDYTANEISNSDFAK